MSHGDYRLFLTEEFAARKARNRQYSFRAFCRDLRVPADQLCSILRRRYGLSRRRAEAIARRLGLGAGESSLFCNLVEAEHGRSQAARERAQRSLAELAASPELSLDSFKLVADWQHFAVLELADLDSGRLDPATVPKRLGITAKAAKDAVGRLLKLGLLVRDGEGLRAAEQQTFAPSGVADRSKRRFLGQLGAKGLEALERQAYEDREFSSDLFSIGPDDLAEARRLVKAFRAGLAAMATKPGKKDRVYCANVQIFEVGR